MTPRRALAAALGAAAVALAACAWLWAPWHYYAASQLQSAPQPLRDVGLRFPAGREGIDYFGTLRMDVYIDERGKVDRVEVLEASVPPAFLESAVRAFEATPFAPGVRYGRPVKSVKRVEVRFAAPVGGLR